VTGSTYGSTDELLVANLDSFNHLQLFQEFRSCVELVTVKERFCLREMTIVDAESERRC